MKAVLVAPPFERRPESGLLVPLGLCQVASALRAAGADVVLWDAASENDFVLGDEAKLRVAVETRMAAEETVDAVLVGVGPLVTATLESTRLILASARRNMPGAHLVVGGPLCGAPGFHEVASSFLGADSYVVGDGETPAAQLWTALTSGRPVEGIGGLGVNGGAVPERHEEADLDSLPLPSRELLSADLYQVSTRRGGKARRSTGVIVSRGCPLSCIFCCGPQAGRGRNWRFGWSRVTAELDACSDQGFTDVVFYDDALFVRSAHVADEIAEFVDAIRSSRWHGTYQLELSPSVVAAISDTTIDLLQNSGCRQINMGIEKADDQSLARLGKRLTIAEVREACERLAVRPILSVGTFIVGAPGESLGDLGRVADFAVSLPLDYAQFNPLAVYPGTTLFDQVFPNRSDGWLDLCLDRQLAPTGDILWQDGIGLRSVAAALASAYERFYTTDRLERVRKKLAGRGETTVSEGYERLRTVRGRHFCEVVERVNGGAVGRR